MLSQLGRDLSTAEQRILYHRAFVNGEINKFLNEFELKRNEIEVETLFKVTEIIGDVKYDLYERCIALSTSHLEELNREVNNLLVGAEGFLTKVELQRQVGTPTEYLIQSRKDREQKKANFFIDLEHKYERVKNSFEEKEEEIDELYSDLQVKLNIPK